MFLFIYFFNYRGSFLGHGQEWILLSGNGWVCVHVCVLDKDFWLCYNFVPCHFSRIFTRFSGNIYISLLLWLVKWHKDVKHNQSGLVSVVRELDGSECIGDLWNLFCIKSIQFCMLALTCGPHKQSMHERNKWNVKEALEQ